MKLSVVIPVFNEADTILKVIERVEAVDLGLIKELVIIDDCSTDGTGRVLEEAARNHPGWILGRHEVNQGKGAALRTGFRKATGDIVVIQDADLEYDPQDLKHLLKPILDGHADVVFGSRFLGGGAHRVVYFWHYLGNRMLTTLCNMVTNLNLTDMEVCYKAFRREVMKNLEIQENRFGVEVELTAKVAHSKCRIFEVPISYYGRTYAEGKKIGWKDGISAFRCILKYGLF